MATHGVARWLLAACLLAAPGCGTDEARAPAKPAASGVPDAARPAAAPPADAATGGGNAPAAPTSAAAAVTEVLLQPIELGYAAEPNARVAALDLDGDGRQELAVASARELAVLRVEGRRRVAPAWRADAPGGATAVATGDLDGDGRADLVVGWGVHRDKRDAPASLRAYRTRDAPAGGLREELVAAPETSRAQFGSIRVTPIEAGGRQGLLYTHYVSTFDVRGAFAELGPDAGWTSRELFVIRMGAEVASVPAPPGAGTRRLVVGRPYGDAPRAPGDVFVLGPGGERTLLPALRGVRSLAALRAGPANAPLELLCYGDGWHWRYRDEGRGRLTCARELPDGSFAAQLVAETRSYSIETLASADLDGDGVQEIVGQGADGLYRFTPGAAGADGPSWSAQQIGPGGFHFAVADTDGDGRSEIALAGETLRLLALP